MESAGGARSYKGGMSPLERLGELFTKLDVFFSQAKLHHGPAITCRAGCDDCCRRRFSVTSIEAAALLEAIDRLPLETRRVIQERASREEPACPLLAEDGHCEVYAERPAICRTHGLPIRFPPEPGVRSLPMIDACPKNFVGRDLTSLDGKGVLDQATASTILAALDAAYADTVGIPRGERVAIVELCREACPDEPAEDAGSA
jgi:hypothetical protein